MPDTHTPGPWKVSPTDDTVVIDADRNVVAEIDGDYNQPETWPLMEANARLIAAAPTMLAALKLFVEDHRNTYDGEPMSLERAEFVELAYAIAANVEGK